MEVPGDGGPFPEHYAMDPNDDLMRKGYDGPGHTAIAQGKTKARHLKVYQGKAERSLSSLTGSQGGMSGAKMGLSGIGQPQYRVQIHPQIW